MNRKTVLELRAIHNANPAFPVGDPRAATMWRRLKRAYNKVSRPDRHPDRLGAALVRAMIAMTPAK